MEHNVSQGGKPAKPRLQTVTDARAIMLAAVTPLEGEPVALADALARALAANITASRDQPPFAASAMDGYAVRAVDTPACLRLIGEATAGQGFAGCLEPGTAVRISTGAPVPEGADTIAIQEDVQRDNGHVTVPATRIGRHIRPRGGDFAVGAVLLKTQRKLDGVALALAAASGTAVLQVVRQPRVAILCSGDELAAPGGVPGPFQVYDSATHGVAALIRSWGGQPFHCAITRDDAGAIAAAAEGALRDCDLLVVVGGASVGDHDHARPALVRLGLRLAVEKIAVRPGKPTWFGVTPQGPVLGLPGNPASALVCAHLFLRPVLEAMLGRDPDSCVMFRRARLAQALPANGPREHYLRAWVDIDDDGRLVVRAHEDQDSSLLAVFSTANALIRLKADCAALEAGALVDILLLDGL